MWTFLLGAEIEAQVVLQILGAMMLVPSWRCSEDKRFNILIWGSFVERVFNHPPLMRLPELLGSQVSGDWISARPLNNKKKILWHWIIWPLEEYKLKLKLGLVALRRPPRMTADVLSEPEEQKAPRPRYNLILKSIKMWSVYQRSLSNVKEPFVPDDQNKVSKGRYLTGVFVRSVGTSGGWWMRGHLMWVSPPCQE